MRLAFAAQRDRINQHQIALSSEWLREWRENDGATCRAVRSSEMNAR
jgi:hypothetical protein